MQPSSSLSSLQPSKGTHESDIWRRLPIIASLMARGNFLNRWLQSVSAIANPSIRLTGSRLFNHSHMPTMHKYIIRREQRYSVSYCDVKHWIPSYFICHCRYQTIFQHLLSPIPFASAFYKELPRFEGVLTEHWKRLKCVKNDSLTSRFPSLQRSYQSNTYLSTTQDEKRTQPRVLPTNFGLSSLSKTVGPFQIVSTIPDTFTIDEECSHNTTSIDWVTRTPNKTDITSEIDKTSVQEDAWSSSTRLSHNEQTDKAE